MSFFNRRNRLPPTAANCDSPFGSIIGAEGPINKNNLRLVCDAGREIGPRNIDCIFRVVRGLRIQHKNPLRRIGFEDRFVWNLFQAFYTPNAPSAIPERPKVRCQGRLKRSQFPGIMFPTSHSSIINWLRYVVIGRRKDEFAARGFIIRRLGLMPWKPRKFVTRLPSASKLPTTSS